MIQKNERFDPYGDKVMTAIGLGVLVMLLLAIWKAIEILAWAWFKLI